MKNYVFKPIHKFLFFGLIAIIFIFLARIVIIPHIMQQRKKVQHKARMMTLNHRMPDFQGLIQFMNNPSLKKAEDLLPYQKYYEAVVDSFPTLADAYLAYGYCTYYQSDLETTLRSFNKAHQISQSSFFPLFNLGVIFYHEGRYAEAAYVLNQAVSTDVKANLLLMFSSKVITQILSASQLSKEQMARNLMTHYGQAYYLLADSLQKEGKPVIAQKMMSQAKIILKRQQAEILDPQDIILKIF